jgi:hypothetical protein
MPSKNISKLLEELIIPLTSKKGILTGSRHPVLFNAGIKPNDLDILIPNSTELEYQNWIKSICERFDLTYDRKKRTLYKDTVKVADLIFTRGSVKSETFNGIECVSVVTLLNKYHFIKDLDDRTGKNDNMKIEILEKYLSQSKSLSRSRSPSPHVQKKYKKSKSLLFHTPKKSLSFADIKMDGEMDDSEKENCPFNFPLI